MRLSITVGLTKHYPPPRNNRFAFQSIRPDVQIPRRLSRRGSVVQKPDFVLLSLVGRASLDFVLPSLAAEV